MWQNEIDFLLLSKPDEVRGHKVVQVTSHKFRLVYSVLQIV